MRKFCSLRLPNCTSCFVIISAPMVGMAGARGLMLPDTKAPTVSIVPKLCTIIDEMQPSRMMSSCICKSTATATALIRLTRLLSHSFIHSFTDITLKVERLQEVQSHKSNDSLTVWWHLPQFDSLECRVDRVVKRTDVVVQVFHSHYSTECGTRRYNGFGNTSFVESFFSTRRQCL